MGQDAQLRHATSNEVNVAMNAMRIDKDVQTAITNKDQQALESLLGASTNVCCMIQAESSDEITSAAEESTVNQHATDRVFSVA